MPKNWRCRIFRQYTVVHVYTSVIAYMYMYVDGRQVVGIVIMFKEAYNDITLSQLSSATLSCLWLPLLFHVLTVNSTCLGLWANWSSHNTEPYTVVAPSTDTSRLSYWYRPDSTSTNLYSLALSPMWTPCSSVKWTGFPVPTVPRLYKLHLIMWTIGCK